MLYLFMQEKESSRASFYFSLYPQKTTSVMLQILNIIYHFPDTLACLCFEFFLWPCLFVCLPLHFYDCGCSFFCTLHVPSERLFHLSSCRKVVVRAADQRQNPYGQQGPRTSARCFPSLLAPQLELSLFNQVWLIAFAGVGCTGSLFFSFVRWTWDKT